MRLRRKHFPQPGPRRHAGPLRSRAARLGLLLGGVLVGLAVACLITGNIRLISLERNWGREVPPVNPAAPPGSFDALPSYEAEWVHLAFRRWGVTLGRSSYTSFATEDSVDEASSVAAYSAWRSEWQRMAGWSARTFAPAGEGLDRDPLDVVTLQGLTRWRLGPLWCKGYLRQGEDGVILHVPYMLIAAAGLLLATPAIVRYLRRRPGACPKCGYDWNGLETCPECGWQRPEHQEPVAGRNR